MPRDAQATRAAFVAATADLLRRQGYAATGLNEITRHSGAPRGSLYFHFPEGKEQLAITAMTESGATLRRAIERLLDSSDDIGTALARLVDAMAAGLEASAFEVGCPLATVTLEAAATSPAIRATVDAAFTSWLDVLERRLSASGMSEETARSRATLVLSALEGALILARARGDVGPLRAVRDELIALGSDVPES